MARPSNKNKNAIVKTDDLTVSEAPDSVKVSNSEIVEKDVIIVESGKPTVANILEQINDSVDSVSAVVTPTKRDKVENNVPLDEEIPCKSVTFGGLTWVSPKTNSHYRWNQIGDVEYISFSELITLNNTKRDFLHKPLFVVQDERVVKYFRLAEVYEKVAQIHNLKEVFKGSLGDIVKVLDTAINVNMRGVVISKVRQMRKAGTLNSIDIIKLIEKKLAFDLSEDESIDED